MSFITRRVVTLSAITILLLTIDVSRADDDSEDPLAGHPRESYENVKDIDTMETALRESLAGQTRYSFSRGWWGWDRLRCRYVDGGRTDKNTLRILRAVFRGLILDWQKKLKAKGEGDLFYIFFSTAPGNKGAMLPAEVAKTITTRMDHKGNAEATIGRVQVTVRADGQWSVKR